ncbi:MAG TPA: hypothetical protein VFX50_15240 [Gemmatimonadales bacterium]|nr:hypothetical protein [Gemmatimonadales bacterium]
MRTRSTVVALGMGLLGAVPLAAQTARARPVTMGNDALIREAMSAAPREIAENATVLAPALDGGMRELRKGTNGWTCMPDSPDTPGKDPMCLDAQGMQWAMDWHAGKERPTNTAPGLAYMLAGGSDVSANDPWAKPDESTKFIASPPHYMVLWPFTKESGLSDQPKKTGTWIMWAGTPYAHLMVNQTP